MPVPTPRPRSRPLPPAPDHRRPPDHTPLTAGRTEARVQFLLAEGRSLAGERATAWSATVRTVSHEARSPRMQQYGAVLPRRLWPADDEGRRLLAYRLSASLTNELRRQGAAHVTLWLGHGLSRPEHAAGHPADDIHPSGLHHPRAQEVLEYAETLLAHAGYPVGTRDLQALRDMRQATTLLGRVELLGMTGGVTVRTNTRQDLIPAVADRGRYWISVRATCDAHLRRLVSGEAQHALDWELRHQRALLTQVCWTTLTPGVRTVLELRREPGFVHLAVCEDRP
ncbi:hypothetical protein GCM10008960_41390 [Deinococcus sedimenti]|uniref:Uncharacterized protein n=1 Tax=Deinococcus sedimenti TaxID=1867090 RepID=A0ABQ2S9E0_9DEIO|nr:hypothetical protein GCM10008960_41390 [Deinococcus sedimenti]